MLKNIGLKRLLNVAAIAIVVVMIGFVGVAVVANHKMSELVSVDREMSAERIEMDEEQVRLAGETADLLNAYSEMGQGYYNSLSELKVKGFELLSLVMRFAEHARESGTYLSNAIEASSVPEGMGKRLAERRIEMAGSPEGKITSTLAELRDRLKIEAITVRLAEREEQAQAYLDQIQLAVVFDKAAKKKLKRFKKKLKSAVRAIAKGFLTFDSSDHRLSSRIDRYKLLQTERITYLMSLVANPAQQNANAALAGADALAGRSEALHQRDNELKQRHADVHQRSVATMQANQEAAEQRQLVLASVRWTTGVFIVLLLLIAVGGSWVLHQVVLVRVFELNRAMHSIAQEGNLAQRLQIDGKDEFGQIANDFNMFVSNFQEIVLNLKRVIDRLDESNLEMSSVSSVNAETAGHLEHSVNDITASVMSLREGVDAVAQEAQQTDQAARKAAELTRSAGPIARACFSASGEVSQATSKTVEKINEVVRNAEEIYGVLDLIRSISDQTNMLALNAAIEAARAGEMGRGFAVVADEVRNLSHRTQEAVSEIGTKLESLSADTSEAANLMESMSVLAHASGESASSVRSILEEIIQEVSRIADLNAEIAQATGEQRSTVAEIDDSIEGVASAVHSTHDGVERIAKVSDGLKALLNNMDGIVRKFRVG